jgi:lipoate-protein ligase B
MGSRIALLRPGLVPYGEALELQRRAADAVGAGGDETLILLGHPPTYTLGVRGRESNLLLPLEAFAARGAEVVRTDRGGDVTFHGPGQIVGYPIINLRARGTGPATYVRSLEQVLIEAVATFGIDAARESGRPGVWTHGAKIAALGVRVSGGVTTHGFALNVNTDLSWFDSIIPCGITDASVTSMQRIAGHGFDMREVEDALIASFASVFDAAFANERALATEVAVGR